MIWKVISKRIVSKLLDTDLVFTFSNNYNQSKRNLLIEIFKNHGRGCVFFDDDINLLRFKSFDKSICDSGCFEINDPDMFSEIDKIIEKWK